MSSIDKIRNLVGAPKLMYSVNGLATESGLSRPYLYNDLAKGRLKSVRVGGRRLIPGNCAVDYIADLLASGIWEYGQEDTEK